MIFSSIFFFNPNDISQIVIFPWGRRRRKKNWNDELTNHSETMWNRFGISFSLHFLRDPFNFRSKRMWIEICFLPFFFQPLAVEYMFCLAFMLYNRHCMALVIDGKTTCIISIESIIFAIHNFFDLPREKNDFVCCRLQYCHTRKVNDR